MRPYQSSTNMYKVLTEDAGHFICFIGHCSFMQGNLQSEKISILSVKEEEEEEEEEDDEEEDT